MTLSKYEGFDSKELHREDKKEKEKEEKEDYN